VFGGGGGGGLFWFFWGGGWGGGVGGVFVFFVGGWVVLSLAARPSPDCLHVRHGFFSARMRQSYFSIFYPSWAKGNDLRPSPAPLFVTP